MFCNREPFNVALSAEDQQQVKASLDKLNADFDVINEKINARLKIINKLDGSITTLKKESRTVDESDILALLTKNEGEITDEISNLINQESEAVTQAKINAMEKLRFKLGVEVFHLKSQLGDLSNQYVAPHVNLAELQLEAVRTDIMNRFEQELTPLIQHLLALRRYLYPRSTGFYGGDLPCESTFPLENIGELLRARLYDLGKADPTDNIHADDLPEGSPTPFPVKMTRALSTAPTPIQVHLMKNIDLNSDDAAHDERVKEIIQTYGLK